MIRGLALFVVIANFIHERAGVALIEHHLPSTSTKQIRVGQLLRCYKPAPNRHAIESIEEIESRFLIFV